MPLNIDRIEYDNLTTVQRDALTLPATGTVIYNVTTNQQEVNTGTPAAPVWEKASGVVVSSVNMQTGAVVLDADDISDAATTNKFVTAADITNLGNLSGTNSGDEVEEYANFAAFPGTGVTTVLYVAQDTNKLYRWNGASYEELSQQSAYYQDPVIDQINFKTSEPVSPTIGDRYINTTPGNSSVTAQAMTDTYIYEWNGTDWTEIIPEEGYTLYDKAKNTLYSFNGTAWEAETLGEDLETTLGLGNISGSNDIVLSNQQKLQLNVAGNYLRERAAADVVELITAKGFEAKTGDARHLLTDNTFVTGKTGSGFGEWTISHQSGEISFVDNNTSFQGALDLWSGLTASRVWTLPNESGVVALVSDIPTGALASLNTVGTSEIDNNSVDNTKLSDMAAYTLKLRNNAASGDPQDVKISGLTDATAFGSGDKLMIEESTGELRKIDFDDLPTAAKKTFTIMGSRDTNVNLDTDMRVDSVLTNTTPMIITPNQAGTYTLGIGASSGTADTWEAHVYKNGVSIAFVAMTAQTKNQNTTASVVVAAGDEIRLRAVNVSGSVSRPRINTFWNEE